MKILHLNFIPRSADVALLLLRIWYGASMLLLHGWGKLTGYSAMAEKFGDPIGLGPKLSLALVVLAEVVGSVLLVLGAFTRVAALLLIVDLGVAFWIAHGHKLTGAGNGELAFLFLGVYVALFIAGAGKHSVDANIGGAKG
jgi:putative oxidoreductase